MGPFTNEQRAKAWKETEVRPGAVLNALIWLKHNNPAYASYKLPELQNIPQPIIIDKSELVQSENTELEKKFEYTVVFPETDGITTHNGGCMTKEDFQSMVIESLDSTTNVTMLSPPTTTTLRDYECNTIELAFPLQFPYGSSGPPISKKDGKVAAGTRIEYIKYLLRLSNPNMHKADFVLVLHNMYERHRAVKHSFLKCINRMGEDSTGESYSKITINSIRSAFACAQSGIPVRDRVLKKFIGDIQAVCKSMGHTNDAAKKARLHMFANIVRFGIPTLFLTVTPDDGNSFRLEVYVRGRNSELPTLSDPGEVIDSNVAQTLKWRQEFPGLCSFEFEQITSVIIDHILGWDVDINRSKQNGGIFGKVKAWCAAVEEQGRKTLHHHWLLWVDGWTELLADLYSESHSTRTEAIKKLENYIETTMQNRMFGYKGDNAQKEVKHKVLCQELCGHNCANTTEQDAQTSNSVTRSRIYPLKICTDQDLRNLRYRLGTTLYGGKSFLKCQNCPITFTSEELKQRILSGILRSDDNMDNKAKLYIRRYLSGAEPVDTDGRKETRDLLVTAMTNLHSDKHKATCFKKGEECRSCLPTKPCSSTKTHFDIDNQDNWWTWNGVKSSRAPYLVEQERHPFDIFVNTHNKMLSNNLGCNTNVQCGIGGGAIIYNTYYAAKNNQTDETRAYMNTASTLTSYVKKRSENDSIDGESESATPFSEGYKRLLCAVFSHTKAKVTSAPMASFIIQNDGRFIFSHDSAYIPLDSFMGRASYTRLNPVGSNLFFMNKRKEYTSRPTELDNVCLYDFVKQYEVIRKNKRNEEERMEFQPTYEHRDEFCIKRREHDVTPLVSHLDFPNACCFKGNIMEDTTEITETMEHYAKAAFVLFVPFRRIELFDGNAISFASLFRDAVRNEEVSNEKLNMLQSIQDCKNLLGMGRQSDVLERVTEDVPSLKCKGAKGERESESSVEKYIEECMTDMIAELNEEDNTRDEERKDKNGHAILSFGDLSGSPTEPLVSQIADTEVDIDTELIQRASTDKTMGQQNNERNFTPLTRERLTTLLATEIKRKVDNAVQLVPTGTAESIQAWAAEAFSDKSGNNTDKDQKRAFEVIVSTFVLSYFTDVANKEKCLGNWSKNMTDIFERDTKRQKTSHTRRGSDIILKREEKKLKIMTGLRGAEQLIMFLTGAGGSGKSRVISHVLSYALGFCKLLDVQFHKRTIVVTALTGVAATMIDGETLDSAAHLQAKKISPEYIDEWKDSRLLIVDEVSFASKEVIANLHQTLCKLKQRRLGEKYGGLHVVFAGDFSQLEPVGSLPLYCVPNFAIWHDWMNSFIELKGQHRYSGDRTYGNIMKRFREGKPTHEDIECLNSRVVDQIATEDGTLRLPHDIAYAVYTNRRRSQINNAVFNNHLQMYHSQTFGPPPPGTIIIKADNVQWKTNKKNLNTMALHNLWEQCSDSQVETANSRPKPVDPCLKLHYNIPLMYTDNDDVENKKANGTLCRLKRVVLHEHTTDEHIEMTNVNGYYVNTVGISRVKHLLCTYMENGLEKEMEVVPKLSTCRVHMPLSILPGIQQRHYVRIALNYFPLVVNYATTGHKLQGQTKESLFVKELDYRRNWLYVVLSRVKSLNGLFLQLPIDGRKDFRKDNRLHSMMSRFKKLRPADVFEEWYQYHS